MRKMGFEQLSVVFKVTVPQLKARLSNIPSLLVYGNQQTPNNKWDVLLLYECIVWIANESSTELGCNGLYFLKSTIRMLYICIRMLYCNCLGGSEDSLTCLLFWMCVYMMYGIYPEVFLLQPSYNTVLWYSCFSHFLPQLYSVLSKQILSKHCIVNCIVLVWNQRLYEIC